jgi:UDP-glucose 4-epimerase
MVRYLHRKFDVLAIDQRDFTHRPADVKHHQAELSRKRTRNQFRGEKVQAVIHLGANTTSLGTGPDKFTRAIENYAKLLEYCDRYNVKKLVLLSSANLYGALPGNSQFLTEEAPLLCADLSALRDIDMMTQSFFWKRPDIETVILRPTHITGAVNGVLSRYLRLANVPLLWGYDPMIQLVHEEDVIAAILLSLAPGYRGIFNIAGPPPVPLLHIIKTLSRKTYSVPHPLARPVLRHLNKLGILELHPVYIDYIRYVCMVDDSRARTEMGYLPLHDLHSTIGAVDSWF